MDGFLAVKETILEELDPQAFPPFLHQTVAIFGKLHLYYRTFKQVRLFKKAANDPARGHPAIYGAALHLAGDYTSIGYAVNVALITKCTEDLLREYRKVSQAYLRLLDAVRWQYPLYHPVEWRRSDPNRQIPISPSIYLLWQVHFMSLARQIQKITQCASLLLWQAFKLSMCLQDAYLLLNGDPQMRFEACTELVGEWELYKNQLQEDQRRLLEEIIKNRQLIDRLLNRMGAPKASQFIIDTLQAIEKPIQQTAAIVGPMEDVYDTGEEVLDVTYAIGKLTPFHIILAEEQVIPFLLPPSRFPPWAGQKVELIVPPPPVPPLKALEDLFANATISLTLDEPINGLLWLADKMNNIYKEQPGSDSTSTS